MLDRLARQWLFATLLLVAWTFARSASAMPAGVCDDRGACAIAAPPSLHTPGSSIGRGAVEVPSLGDGVPLDGKVGVCPDGGPQDAPPANVDPAIPPDLQVRLAPAVSESWAPMVSSMSGARGMRYRVERPPR
jgi:hypothetical protein